MVGVTEGVFDLTKKTTATFAVGDKVSWDSTNHYCDAPGTGLYPVGTRWLPPATVAQRCG